MLFVELRPWLTATIIFVGLTIVHIVLLNIAGAADGLYVGDKFLFLAGTTPVEIVLLAFLSYSVVLPTLIGHACITAYDSLRPSLMLDDRGYGETRAGIVDSFLWWRFWSGLGCAAILTPPFGDVLRHQIHEEGAAAALLAIWMYVRISITFGLLGATTYYVVALDRRFRAVTAEHLRIDLFDFAPLRPISRYARQVALYLAIFLALVGPAVVQPEAMAQSVAMLALGITLSAFAVIGVMSGARNSIRVAKKTAITELSAYARELWRRAYAGQHIVEAVAVPALGAMIVVRNEIRRVGEWPGGWSVFARFTVLAILALLSWFGGQIVARLLDLLAS